MPALDASSLDQLFRTARTRNAWSPRPVEDQTIQDIYDLLKLGPTSANSSPARFVWVRSEAARQTLADCAMGANPPKILAAPVTVIIGRDMAFADRMPELFPHAPHMHHLMKTPGMGEATAVRNTTLQGGWLIMAARALGLDCGPMSGFDRDKVDAAFFAGTTVTTDFLCSLGYGTDEGLFDRLPRLAFDDANRIV
ncbi:malonic semialdehyde reductase [Brevundimonas sp.]|uniref:malonic semialdehyde reductase n=1 Tax=Brevundimonas sp. TaxID=1871086 RepID=UPI003D096430